VTEKTLRALALATLLVGASASRAHADEVHTAPAASAQSSEELRTFVPGAAALEGKILAPCCWNQTVDIHGSEIANQIRSEIRRRLRAGESADAIQASLVDRYGAKILAMPADSPLAGIAFALLVGIGGVGVAGFFMLKRWRRAGAASKTSKKEPRDEASNERLDARLDAELRALDE
jgi:cytochrome c-type biogenesis protein CcmH